MKNIHFFIYYLSFLQLFNSGSRTEKKLYLAEICNKYGYVDSENNLILEAKYSRAREFSDGLANVTLASDEDELAGFIDKSGKMVIEPQYIFAWDFENDIAVVAKESRTRKYKYGVINKKNEVLVDFKYDELKVYKDIAVTKSYGKYGIIKIGGEELIGGYDYISSFNFDYQLGRKGNSDYIISTGGDVKKIEGYIIEYTSINKFGYFIVEKDGFYGVLNYNMDIVIPCKYDEIEFLKNDSRILANTKDVSYIISPEKDLILEIDYHSFYSLNQRFGIFKQDNKLGVINDSLEFIIPPIYDRIFFNTSNDVYKCILNGKEGLIDKKGNELLPCKYDDIIFKRRGIVKLKIKNPNRYGVYNIETNSIIEPGAIIQICGFINNRAIIKTGDRKFSLVDLNFNLITEETYIDLEFLPDGSGCLFEKKRSYGVIDLNGNIIR